MFYGYNQEMPEIDVEAIRPKLLANHKTLLDGIVATRGKNKGRLRASKPKVDRKGTVAERLEQGSIAYVWRMVAFFISPKPQHSCIPVTVDFDLPWDYFNGAADRREYTKLLDDMVVDPIVDTIKPKDQYGVRRWAKALGY